MGREWIKLEKGLYKVGDKIFFRMMVNGKREMEKSPVQGSFALDGHGRPTKDLRKAFMNWQNRLVNREWLEGEKGKRIPTFQELIDLYEQSADEQRIKTGKPGEYSAYNMRKAFEHLVDGCGLQRSQKATTLTMELIDKYVYETIKGGLTPITAWSYAMGAKSVTARWMKPYFARAGFEVVEYEMPVHKGKQSRRYERLSQETRDKIATWYNGLWERDKKWWIVATMMLHFAMRDGDVQRLTWKNFVRKESRWYLIYTPHKTSTTSGRVVKAVVDGETMKKLEEAADSKSGTDEKLLQPKVAQFAYWLQPLIADMREKTGLKGSKALYELRKLCVDYYYRTFGAEAATAISGDDIKTITYYYLDPSDVKTDRQASAAQILG